MVCARAPEHKAEFSAQKSVRKIWCMMGSTAVHRLVCFRRNAWGVQKVVVIIPAQGLNVFVILDTMEWIASNVWRDLPRRLAAVVSEIVI